MYCFYPAIKLYPWKSCKIYPKKFEIMTFAEIIYTVDARKHPKTGYLYPDSGVAHNAYGYQEIYIYNSQNRLAEPRVSDCF
jgi:hypothetical protein